MMKKLFLWILMGCLLLPICASAETIAQQINAPSVYQAEYYSNTGKSAVLVDAVVYVPDVESFHTYAVTGRDFSLQEAKSIALAAAPETEWLTDWHNAEETENRNEFSCWESEKHGEYGYRLRFEWLPQHDGSEDYYPYKYGHYEGSVDIDHSFKKTVFGARRTFSRLEYEYCQIKDDGIFYKARTPYLESAGQTPAAGAKLSGQSLTWGEAEQMAKDFAAQAAPGFSLVWRGQAAGEGTSRKAYAFCFTQVVNGVPITYAVTAGQGDEADEQHYTSPPKDETLTCVIHQDRIVSVVWDNPWEIGIMLQENVELLPFDQIMSIFGTICPLSIQNMENEYKAVGGSGNRWEITEIRLGYMPVLRKDNSGLWELRPVWDFIGIRSFAKEYYDWPGNCALTIDAIDGTVIDRSYGY